MGTDTDARETEHWHCEHCGEKQTGDPAATQTYIGYRDPVELWFCEDCANV